MLILMLAVAVATPQPKALKCEFTHGVFKAFDEPEKLTSDSLTLIFDSIDPNAGTARLIGNQGAGDVKVVPADGQLTFIETTAFGNVHTTTVFLNSKPFRAVTSRHLSAMQGPLLSQLYGECKPF
jgi:hypothetical protein